MSLLGYWELWDCESGNQLDDFTSLDAALCFVATVVRNHGPDAVKTWAIAYDDADADQFDGVLEDDALLAATLNYATFDSFLEDTHD